MKKLLLAALAVTLCLVARAALRTTLLDITSVPISPAAAAFRAELDELWLLLGPQSPEYWENKTNTQIARIRNDAEQHIIALAEKFYRGNPGDPLRWEAVLKLTMLQPGFVRDFKPGLDEAPKDKARFDYYVIDEPAKKAWQEKQAAYLAALRSAADAPVEVREYREFLDLVPEIGAATRQGPAAIGAAEKKIDAFAAKFPVGRQSAPLYTTLFRAKLREGGVAAEEIWGRLAASPNRAVADQARAELRKAESQRQPIELAFTAIDGREVDVTKLRGKVVLIDFWATWCGPCKAEVPNVVAVYNKYHDRGFEVIGISLDKADAKQALLDYTAANGMPWPQHFDGKFWKNEFARKFAVNAIPAMFLLDQTGKVVSTDARGSKLEAEVKRLLGL